MTMIEKVEEAIKFVLGIDHAKEAAEAAIKAMRYPTKEMIIAGWSCFDTELELPLIRYRAMIEAALNDIPDPEQN